MGMMTSFRAVLMFIFGSIIILGVLVPFLNSVLSINPLVDSLLRDWFGLAILVGCLGLVGSMFLPDPDETEQLIQYRQQGAF